MTSPRNASGSRGFVAFGLAGTLVSAVTSLGYEEPTPVQCETIPLLLSGRDMLAQAATGTGKTAAFALPMLHHLLTNPPSGRRRTRGLVLVPTRELAMQVAEAIHKYARSSGLFVVPVYGGASMSMQIRALSRGADIVVATPGRALDHLRRRTLDLEGLRVLVLDEADEMLDMGFAEDLDAILEATPEARQTALFSATIPPRILSIAHKHLRDPQRITVAREKTVGWTSCRGCASSPMWSAGRRSRRPSSACSTWRAPRRPWCSAGRGWKWTRSSRRSTPMATVPRRSTAGCSSGSATA